MNLTVRNDDAIVQTARILLRRVLRILRGCGLSEAQLRVMSNEVVDDIELIPDSQPSRVTARQALMCSDVVLRWRRGYEFLDAEGSPRSISYPSFVELVKRAAPGADSDALLITMQELGVVRTTEKNEIELTSESVVVCSGRDGAGVASEFVLEHICGFLGSVEFNVFDKPSRARGRFERACYASVPKELVPVLQQLVSKRGQDFVDVIDEWLSRRTSNRQQNDETMLVGAGAYIFVRSNLE